MLAPDADVDPRARVAESATVWGLAQIRENAVVGENCIIGRGAYIDAGVVIGDNCKIQNNALIYAPAELGDGVFVGPAAVFTNDTFPRAINPDGSLKDGSDWEMVGVTVESGASIGARAVVLGGVTVGKWALVAAGTVVTKDVPPHGLIAGVPGKRLGWVGVNGRPLEKIDGLLVDQETGRQFAENEGRLERP